MEPNSSMLIKRKRCRINPIKKWSVIEEKALIEFLLENRELERPTAQIFYKRFSREKNITVDWKQVRSKVRNLKINFYKAKQWQESTSQSNVDDSTRKSTLLKICSYFDELEDIFVRQPQKFTALEDSLESCTENFLNSTEVFKEETTTASDTSIQDSLLVTASSSCKDMYSRIAGPDIMSWQSEAIEIKNKRLDFGRGIEKKEVSVMERTMILKESELLLRAKEIENMKEIKLKELEIQKDLKMAELEMKERLAMEELKMKYKTTNQ